MSFTSQISLLTGLDDFAIQSQILPHLESYTDANSLTEYLTGFLGSEAKSFITSFVEYKFGKTASSIAPVPSRPSSSNGPREGPRPVDLPAKRQTKPAKISDAEVIADMPIQVRNTIKTIDHAIKVMSLPPTSEAVEKSRCFCQARKHALNEYVQICPKCALVLCTLNSPSAPCPSCLNSPLISPNTQLAIKSQQLSQRTILLERYRDVLRIKRQEEEEERRKIKFPELNAQEQLSKKIANAYIQPTVPRKVLSLNLATRKVTTTTTTKPINTIQSDESPRQEETQEQGWIDEKDLGWMAQQSKSASHSN